MLDFDVPELALEEHIEEVGGMAYRAMHLRPAWVAVDEAVAEDNRRLFESSGASGRHGRWPRAKSPRPGGGLLKRTRRLMGSVSNTKHPDHVFEATDERIARLGTRVEYASYHHHGTSRLDQRRVMDLTDAQEDAKADIVERFVHSGELP
ncbi:MAG: hypothetical protein CMH57_02735 [Myxococcales bacterium]|nr:hypothetical protein [Myxococcales bacterium]